MHIKPALDRLREEDHDFEDNLGCIETAYLKTPKKKKKRKVRIHE
jgi:hypothetical protein